MQVQVTITVSPKDENNESLIRKLILREVRKQFQKRDNEPIHTGGLGTGGNFPFDRQFRAGFNSPADRQLGVDSVCSADIVFGAVNFIQIKRSVDARHGGLKIHLKYNVFIDEDISESDSEKLPVWKKADGKKSVIIVGSGPAGLFGALKLLEYGIKPVIIERGEKTDERKKTIAQISTKQTVDENSNYCFGEGGAGTFSDGKLYTRSNKRGNIGRILRIFVNFGADRNILTDAHPHIGTDRLPQIINNMREKIIECGGEFHFNMKVVGIESDVGNIENPEKHLSQTETPASIRTTKGDCPSQARTPADVASPNERVTVVCENTTTHEKSTFSADAILLATGHSATDIYKMIADTSPESLEAKTFAVGVRVEHPRKEIDDIQYHKNTKQNRQSPSGKKSNPSHRESGNANSTSPSKQSGASDKTSHIADTLGAAEYRLTTQVDGRGVYSFCMCPGGFVVPSQTGPDEIVVNGMSNKNRNSVWSNAAIVVETRPEDIPARFVIETKKDGCTALAGLYYRRYLEKLAKNNGNGQKAPAQKIVDFLAHRKSEFANPNEQSGDDRITSYTPGIVSSRLDKWLPPQITDRLSKGFKNFNKTMHGFISDNALMIAIETRTSTPVRILRDSETFECIGLKGVYPAGEGSGYSGGIVSSAMDGENVCDAIARKI